MRSIPAGRRPRRPLRRLVRGTPKEDFCARVLETEFGLGTKAAGDRHVCRISRRGSILTSFDPKSGRRQRRKHFGRPSMPNRAPERCRNLPDANRGDGEKILTPVNASSRSLATAEVEFPQLAESTAGNRRIIPHRMETCGYAPGAPTTRRKKEKRPVGGPTARGRSSTPRRGLPIRGTDWRAGGRSDEAKPRAESPF